MSLFLFPIMLTTVCRFSAPLSPGCRSGFVLESWDVIASPIPTSLSTHLPLRYTFVMGRGAAGAFKQAGVDLAVQNFAVGGGRTLPTTGWCGEAQVKRPHIHPYSTRKHREPACG